VDDGIRSAVAVADLDLDGLPDLITGNLRGGLCYYKGRQPLIFSAIEEESKAAEPTIIKVFPNPSSDYLMVSSEESKGAFRFIMTDLSGRIVLDVELQAGQLNRLNTSQLQSGMYVYRIIIDAAMHTGKVIIQH
jgi:hypothetical protein